MDGLDAPCRFCGYNGSGYWQPGTHEPECPFYEIGGERERLRSLAGKPLPPSKDDTIAALRREVERLNPCGHTGAESFVCEKCGYPDPVKYIEHLRKEVERLKEERED